MARPEVNRGLTRRSVLTGLGATALSLPIRPAWSASTDFDVVIVGAGVAAIGAVDALARAGLSCCIVEAGTRVGGRAFTDPNRFRGAHGAIPFDIGCAWIHAGNTEPDAHHKRANPMALWARKLGFALHHQDPDELDILRWGKRPGSKADFDAASTYLEKRIDTFAERGLCAWPASGVVPTWNPSLLAASTFIGPMDAAVSFNRASIVDLSDEAEYEPNYLVPRGYGTLVDAVAHTVLRNTRVFLSAPVRTIDYSGSNVVVTTAAPNAASLTARAVVVTASIGVLKSEAIRFKPGLPGGHLAALDALDMGLLTKIPLLVRGFPHGASDVKPDANVLIMKERAVPPARFDAADLFFLAWPFDADLMVGFVGGDFAWALSREKDSERVAIDLAKDRLVDLFGSEIRSKVVDGLMTGWGTDPLTLGAYSAAKPGCGQPREALRAPVSDRVFFAGEALADGGMYATCHGAYLSGSAAANRIAVALKGS